MTPTKNMDLRHVDTSNALTLEERRAVLRKRQREALGLTEPRVTIGKFHLPPSVSKQFAYIKVGAH
jgi:hypothetical protein